MSKLFIAGAALCGIVYGGAEADGDIDVGSVTASTGSNELAGHYASDFELEHFDLVNALRANGGTCTDTDGVVTTFEPNPTPLKFDCRLWRASRLHSVDMVEQSYLNHVSKDGRSFVDRAMAQGIAPAGENLISSYALTPAKAVASWKSSRSGHCHGMMNPNRFLFGVGFWVNAKNNWAKGTQMYASAPWLDSLDETSCISDPANGLTPSPTPAPTPAPVPTHIPTPDPTPAPTSADAVCAPQPDCASDLDCYVKYLPLCATFSASQCGKSASITGDPESENCVLDTIPEDSLLPACGPHPDDASATWTKCFDSSLYFGDDAKCVSGGEAKGVQCMWILTRFDDNYNSLVMAWFMGRLP